MRILQTQVQRAIDDIALIRRAVERTDEAHDPGQVREITVANLVLQIAGIVVALSILAAEMVTGHVSSQVLQLSADDPSLRGFSIGMIGLMLLLLVVALYFVIYRASKHSRRDFAKFVARNFSYLRNLSLLSDLLIKFGIVSLLIHIGQPRWVAPILFVFIGDFLFQGRFFTLPLRLSILLGAVCIGAGMIQALLGSALLSWPLAGFVVVSGLSLRQLILQRKSQSASVA